MTDQDDLDREVLARIDTYEKRSVGPSEKFVSKGGQNLTAKEWEPSPEQIQEAEEHFAKLEKEWGVKFEPWEPSPEEVEEAKKIVAEYEKREAARSNS